jgi:glycosyltransferase involved in cell wall biosynthesis
MSGVISVIVPVYNVAKYLPECVENILEQDYKQLEVILINDGSTDHSGAICDEYAAKDPRVVVIHQKNGGAAAAKNAGLRAATGKYLSFVDSDDFLEPGAYSHMVKLLEECGADAVQCAFHDVYRNQTVAQIPHPGNNLYSGVDYLVQYTKDWTCGLLWDKLYVRSIFDGIWFLEGHKIDDEYFTYRGIMNARKVVRDDRVVYNYRKRRSSVMYSPESGKQILFDRIDYLSKRRVNILAQFPELRGAFDRHFVEMMVILSRDPLATKESNAMIQHQLHDYFHEKHHTRIDIRLWPALLQIRCGFVKKHTLNAENTADVQYFD